MLYAAGLLECLHAKDNNNDKSVFLINYMACFDSFPEGRLCRLIQEIWTQSSHVRGKMNDFRRPLSATSTADIVYTPSRYCLLLLLLLSSGL